MSDQKKSSPFPLNTPAAQAIGARSKNDHGPNGEIEPARMERGLENPQQAAPIIQLLQEERIGNIATQYNDANQKAIALATTYRNWGKRSNRALLFSLWLGFAYLLPVGTLLMSKNVWLQILLLVVELVLVFLYLWGRRKSGPGQRYQHEQIRSQAEADKMRFYREILKSDSKGGDPALFLSLKLEFVRRFLLEDQLAWFSRKGNNFAKDINATSSRLKKLDWWYWFLFALAAISVVAMGVKGLQTHGLVEASLLTTWVDVFPVLNMVSNAVGQWLVGIGGMVAAYSIYVGNNIQLEVKERNARRYLDMVETLTGLGHDFGRIQALAAQGDEQGVYHALEIVFRELEAEQREWAILQEALACHPEEE